MKKLLVICGPTATGKTSLGIRLAKKFSGETVSTDSRQVYRYMDIGTGKDLPLNTKYKILNTKYKDYRLGYYLFDSVKVWLLDIVKPNCQFSVANYVKCAEVVIENIWQRERLPILVGGTGFYIKGLIDGIETLGVKPDWELREQLDSWTAGQLGEYLKELDSERWERMSESDRRNPRRLIRAIEIALKFPISPAKRDPAPRDNFQFPNKSQISNSKFQIDRTLFIGLTAPNKILYERIDRRVEERIKQGVIKEIKGLLAKGYSWKNSVLGTTIGYKEWKPYFEISQFAIRNSQLREKIIQRWKYAEHAYARRQMTWFKKDFRIHWVDISKKRWENDVERLVKRWYSGN